MTGVYSKLCSFLGKRKQVALLLDPEKQNMIDLKHVLWLADNSPITMILVGGSLVSSNVDEFVKHIKLHTSLPVVLFPGSAQQFSPSADAMLLLSLISGRNPDFLIGNHVQVSLKLKQSRMEVIPTGYILVESGAVTSVQYMSNTMPIPSNKPDIALATALAGEQLGLKMIYLEAGSGAPNPVPIDLISAIRSEISIPLIVGGGLRTPAQIKSAWDAGADIVVVGNAVETNADLLSSLPI